MDRHQDEIARGDRFAFGANWSSFLRTLTDERIEIAEQELLSRLECASLEGLRFLDIGSGSGIFSLAARRLGATVHSFDYDPDSVACTRELRSRYFPNDSQWTIEEASALDREYVQSLGTYDVVYSWGVLHHTGNLALGLSNAALPVAEHGVLFLAIYNDQGYTSRVWTAIKKLYCSGRPGKWAVSGLFVPLFAVCALLIGLARFGNPLGLFSHYRKRRGMSIYHDWIDWLGGYPFEVARPEEILHVYRDLGFRLRNLISTNRLGCNQFIFEKVVSDISGDRSFWKTATIDGPLQEDEAIDDSRLPRLMVAS